MIKLTEQGRKKAAEYLENTTPEELVYWNTRAELIDDIEVDLTDQCSRGLDPKVYTGSDNNFDWLNLEVIEDYTREVIL